MRLCPRRLLPLLAFVLALSALPAGWSTASSAPAAAPSTDVSLPTKANGEEALRLLGDQLDEAAALNGWAPGELREVLETDETAWVDRDGHVYYVEPTAEGAGGIGGVAPFPLSETFLLHSRPGSQRTIYLDFDGTTISGTAWNGQFPLSNGTYSGFTLDGDVNAFSDAEKEAVQKIWQQVSEDYAPFDVNVTTQDPGLAAIERTNAGDTVYGTRALITNNNTVSQATCNNGCGGIAYVDVFDLAGTGTNGHEYYQPALVFPHLLSNDTKNIAEATSHEVGHNFSLRHDGRTSPVEGYYTGHAMWAPIMGVGYSKPVVQWSKGEYANANNTTSQPPSASNYAQDDVALLAARAPYIPDEAGATPGTAATSIPSRAVVTTADDVDTFALGTCTGTVTLGATGAPPSPDLDIRLRLLDSTGTQVAVSDPAAAFVSDEVASGLDASISQAVATGTYYAQVEGVGVGNPLNTGYSDYGSIGAYTLTESGCAVAPTAPGVPQNLTVTPAANGTSATVTWTAPASDGGSAITGYTVGRTGVSNETQAGTSKTWTGLTPGASYTFTVAATNAVGTGTAASQGATMPTAPGVPGGLTVTPAANGTSATVTWTAPADGGSPITGYTVGRTGASNETQAGTSKTWTGLTPGSAYTFTVAATNAVGTGTSASQDKTMPTTPGVPGGLTVTPAANGTSVTVTWTAPASDGGSPVTGYTVGRTGAGNETQTGTSKTWTGLTPGSTYTFSVAATNAVGTGTAVSQSATTPVPPPANTKPGAPTGVAGKSGSPGGKKTVKFTWSAPSNTGGLALTGYTVQVVKNGSVVKTVSVAAGKLKYKFKTTVGGKYAAVVTASNALGAGTPSAPSAPVKAK